MILLELSFEHDDQINELRKVHPESINIVDGRAIDGTLGSLSVLLAAGAFLVPEIRKVVIEIIKNKRYRCITLKGVKYQGYSEKEITKLLKEVEKTQRGKDGH